MKFESFVHQTRNVSSTSNSIYLVEWETIPSSTTPRNILVCNLYGDCKSRQHFSGNTTQPFKKTSNEAIVMGRRSTLIFHGFNDEQKKARTLPRTQPPLATPTGRSTSIHTPRFPLYHMNIRKREWSPRPFKAFKNTFFNNSPLQSILFH